MKKQAYLLVPGDVVSSGETVINNTKSFGLHGVKSLVTLKNPKTSTTRIATWGYRSTIFMNKNVKPV
jgi:hypothetical protein